MRFRTQSTVFTLLGAIPIILADGSNCVQDVGNYYCTQAATITYNNFGHAGKYDRVVDMNGCKTIEQGFSGPLAPFNEEVSLAFRGPLHLKYFAAYVLGPAPTTKDKRAPAPKHGHKHAHDHKKRSDTVIVATNAGEIFSWTTDAALAAGPNTEPPQPGPSADTNPQPNADAAFNAALEASSSVAVPASASASASTATSSLPPVTFSSSESALGEWTKIGCYNSTEGSADGVVFLKSYYGPMTFCAKDGTSTTSAPEILEDCLVPSNQEYTIWTDKKCSQQNDDCGYYNPVVPAYHGFGGSAKAFLFEFSMPHDTCDEGLNPDAPAIWMLNSLIPRTDQYGCSCWESGCGEFDLFEVLTKSEERMKSTVHDEQSFGSSNWFARPVNEFVKAAVVMQESSVTIAILPNDFDMGGALTADQVNMIRSLPATVDSLPN